MDLHGNSTDMNEMCALQEYFDASANQLVHPFFDMSPTKDLDLKIIVDVIPELNYLASTSNNLMISNQQTKGCVTIYVQSKSVESEGF